MKVHVLGSAGSEGPGSNPPAFLIDDFLLMDAGTVALSLDREEQCRVTHIFLTHAHLDHIKGIPFLVDNLALMAEPCQVTILSGADVLSDLKENMFNNKIWPDFTTIPTPEHPVMRYQAISTTAPIAVRNYRIHAVKVSHSVPSYGYLIEDSSRCALVYTGDTGPTEAIWEKMRDFDSKALIIEVSFPDSMGDLARATGHLTPSLLQEELSKMHAVPGQIYISHLKPHYRAEIEAEIAKITGVDLEILEDGKSFEI